ncbi:MAG: PucR family transcriptional regulator [Euzebya sp.]
MSAQPDWGKPRSGTGTGVSAEGAEGAEGAEADPQRLPDVLSGLSKQNALYRRMIAIVDRVGDTALRGADPQELTGVFAEMVNKAVVLLDSSFHVIAQASGDGKDSVEVWNPWDDSAGRLLSMLAHERRTLRVPAVPGSSLEHGCVATPITVGDTTLGYLLVTDSSDQDESDDIDLLITTYAATLFALTLAHQQTSIDLGQRYRAAVLDALVSGNFLDDQDAGRKAAILGLARTQAFRVGVLGARTTQERRRRMMLSPEMAEELTRLLAARVPEAITAVRGSDLVLLLPAQPEGDGSRDTTPQRVTTALESVSGLLARRSVEVQLTCGLSERLERPEAAPQGLQQANHAIDLGVRVGRAGGVVAYDDLGIYRLLLQIGDMRQLWRFAEEVLGELITYEATHSLDLIGTLSVYLHEHASLKQAARRLRVHTNTISYRIRRVEDLTRLDLSQADDRLSAHVAVKIIESQRAVRQAITSDEDAWLVDTAQAETDLLLGLGKDVGDL